jgi:Zn-dependent M28 family amino/carboxypeptidase
MALGPRTPGSSAHAQAIQYVEAELEEAGWRVHLQQTTWNGFDVRNIVASRSDADPQIILGAHYDSRLQADQDPGPGRSEPVPGANDGASGVAVLLELARTLRADSVPVWLVFFDAEDNGGLDGRDWIMGSRAFAASLTFKPQAVIVLDMIGDADLNVYYEANSDPALEAEIWSQAAELGYGSLFIPKTRFSMIDDHTPFLEAGILAVDLIDFDYPYWHTAADTADKVSAHSLEAVGRTLEAWIATRH